MGKATKTKAQGRRHVTIGPPDWLALNPAFARMLALYGSGDLAAAELFQAMRDGRLKTGAIHVPSQTGQQIVASSTADHQHYVLEPDFWKQFEGLTVAHDRSGVQARPLGRRVLSGRWNFFVRSSDLDAMHRAPSEPKGDDGPQIKRIKQLLPEAYPDGVPSEMMNKEVQAALHPFFKKLGLKTPSVETIRRARKLP